MIWCPQNSFFYNLLIMNYIAVVTSSMEKGNLIKKTLIFFSPSENKMQMILGWRGAGRVRPRRTACPVTCAPSGAGASGPQSMASIVSVSTFLNTWSVPRWGWPQPGSLGPRRREGWSVQDQRWLRLQGALLQQTGLLPRRKVGARIV